MGFAEFVERFDSQEKTLTVLNREAADPVYSLLETKLGDGEVTIREADTESDGPVDVVVVEDETGGDERLAVAASPLSEIRDSLLLVNADLYVTGTVGLDAVETPDAVANLDDVTFDVAGRSKFLLVHISRHIERTALDTDAGVLHSGFQNLGRVHAERGTLRAYRTLAASGVDVHAYGVPDHDPDVMPDALTLHRHDDGEIPRSWFVVHDGAGVDTRKAALVAVETGANKYRGYWTFDPERVDPVLDYVEETYVEPTD
ncbi:MAG: DICT sensory domain-containing protein [Haloarculaceae archaeon]